ncbi:MAG: hypothetical protein M1823_006015 [Watsoniomyces obsoletus]|nr:MAG: hypothetical protein M1823_006015 [Watsoniomyces obsoletus]
MSPSPKKSVESSHEHHDENAGRDVSSHSPSGEQSPGTTKRRKVNHACIYCRRSHMTCDLQRPCTRCIKRSIGHLCHDEPRESPKKHRPELDSNIVQETDSSIAAIQPLSSEKPTHVENAPSQQPPQYQEPVPVLDPPPIPQSATQDVEPPTQSIAGYADWSLGAQNQFHDMHTFHPSYMFNAPEVTNEYNLLNNFLNASLLEDGASFAGEDVSTDNSNTTAPMGPPISGSITQIASTPNDPQSLQAVMHRAALQASGISRPASTKPTDEAREMYYLTAADPSGSDPPEERMNKLLKAKYKAGLLKPFNYVNGYARLSQYMERHLQPASRNKILRQLNKFRPTFRERMQKLTDIELVLVEMWFERSLMAYDRVFASMAIPACCWRRTGEIFRGNREMAELIHVPIERLQDGKLAIHEIFQEESLVGYWEKFGTIAFDKTQKAMLTSCVLKTPDAETHESDLHCCFSFTIRRDSHDIPSLIVGNFLPMDPEKYASRHVL